MKKERLTLADIEEQMLSLQLAQKLSPSSVERQLGLPEELNTQFQEQILDIEKQFSPCEISPSIQTGS